MSIFIISLANPRPRDQDNTGAEAFETGKNVTKFYRRRDHAERAAKALAAKFPGELFGVFEAHNLYEAKAPEIMEKVLNEQGEIVPRG